MTASLDHLVVAAASLAEGVEWCEATLGVAPEPGGEHALFGTHNRLLKLQAHGAPNAYLEIIAVNPRAEPTRAPTLKRWFDFDDPELQARLQQQGPRLIHWVVSVPDLNAALAAWHRLGIDRGPALTASRPTPAGLLEWKIAVRDDGQRLFNGCLPTLIQWGDVHPAQSMSTRALHLQTLDLRHPKAGMLEAALQAIDLHGLVVSTGEAQLGAEVSSPKGLVALHS